MLRFVQRVSLALCISASAPGTSSAQDLSVAPDSAELAALDTKLAALDTKLAALDTYLEDLQRPSRAYWGSWIAVLGALAAGQAVQAVYEEDKAARAGLIVGSSLSTVGLTLVLISPTPGRYASSRYRALPSATGDEKREKLAQGEAWLAGEAASVRRTRSWLTHTVAATVGLGAGLYLGFAFDDNLLGALRTGVGTFVITELRVWTRPTRALAYERDYKSAPSVTPNLAVMPLLLPSAEGISLRGLSLGGTF